jgi:mono/diheme cytochrome c family protein
MYDQPRYKALGRSRFFADQRQARPPVEGTVARGMLRADSKLFAGKDGNTLVADLPLPVTRALLDRGRQRFDIYCAPCHDRTGSGNGMVVQRGYRPPPSFHIERLRSQPVGHFFDVITNGFGAMPDYASQIGAEDRWAIIAYIRALQLSQAAVLSDVPPDAMGALDRPQAAGAIPPESPALPTLYHSAPIPGSSPQSPSGGPSPNPSRKGAN